MRLHRSVAVLAAAATVLVLAACSGSPSTIADRTSAPAAPIPTPIATFGALPTSALDASTAAALQKTLDGELESAIPDVLATVITPDGTWSGAAGVDGPEGRKAAVGDVVSIASVTKTFTSAVIFRLAEQKRIDLDAPLSRYLDAAAAKKANGATVRQALAMRAGLPDTQDAVREAALADPKKISTVDEIVSALPGPTAKPGTESAESNPTYKLLALAAERAGGAPWADLVRTLLVEPADVPGTLLVQTPGTRTPGRWALPTTDGPWGVGGTLPFLADTSFSRGATDMAADTASLATWMWALFAGRVVSPASLAAMSVNYGTALGSGLDPSTEPLPEGALGYHGGKPGYGTQVIAVPAEQTVVVVASNDENAALDIVADDLLNALP